MSTSQSPPPPPPPPPTNPQPNPQPKPKPNRDFLTHLETYLAKRDGVDKLLKISRYTTKLLLSNPNLTRTNPTFSLRLKSFESSVGLSRKAFRLGKFVQDLNAIRTLASPNPNPYLDFDFLLSIIAYGGEGIYYFVEQFVWLAKSGLIDPKRSPFFVKISAWCEFVGYVGSVAMKFRDLKVIVADEECLESSVEFAKLRFVRCDEEEERLRKVREKKTMKRLSIVQDLADSVMALDDMLDGKGPFSTPVIMASAGLLSALISTHKNWMSC